MRIIYTYLTVHVQVSLYKHINTHPTHNEPDYYVAIYFLHVSVYIYIYICKYDHV